jgi:hypothetical protein
MADGLFIALDGATARPLAGEVQSLEQPPHAAPFSPASQRRPRTRGEQMEATHSIEVEVAINFLLSFSAQKPHVKSKNI